MSGHSKWSKVKHQKAVTDVAKAANFTKASRGITIAVKEGGGIVNPDMNFKLRLAIEKAREVNMPKENIERAIMKGTGTDGTVIESLLYEAIGPYKTAMLIEAATENRQRTVSQVKSVLDHNGGVLASPGAVSFQFKRQAVISLTLTEGITEDILMETALAAGVDDFVTSLDSTDMFAEPNKLESIRSYLSQKDFPIESSGIYYVPVQPLSLTDEERKAVDMLISRLEELDDVQNVSTNIL